jgi:uncharacterized protein (DUF1800 family)
MKGRSDKTMSRAKSAKDAKVEFDKKRWNGWGLCELSVLGAINFLAVVLSNIFKVSIQGDSHDASCIGFSSS